MFSLLTIQTLVLTGSLGGLFSGWFGGGDKASAGPVQCRLEVEKLGSAKDSRKALALNTLGRLWEGKDRYFEKEVELRRKLAGDYRAIYGFARSLQGAEAEAFWTEVEAGKLPSLVGSAFTLADLQGFRQRLEAMNIELKQIFDWEPLLQEEAVLLEKHPLDEAGLTALLAKNETFVVVHVMKGCPGCMVAAPIIGKLTRFFPDTKFYFIEDSPLDQNNLVSSFPRIVVRNGATMVHTLAGSSRTTQELYDQIERAIQLGNSRVGMGALMRDEKGFIWKKANSPRELVDLFKQH